MPIWMKALFAGSSLDIRVDIPNLLAKLVITILVPSVAGKVRALARGSSPVAQPPRHKGADVAAE